MSIMVKKKYWTNFYIQKILTLTLKISYALLWWLTNENRLFRIISFLFIDSVPFYKEEFDTLCNLQIFTYLLVFHPYYRIRIQRTQSANKHGQLKKYGRTQRTFFMERGREELLVDQCCKYCHLDRWSKLKIPHLNFLIWKIIKFGKTIRHNI